MTPLRGLTPTNTTANLEANPGRKSKNQVSTTRALLNHIKGTWAALEWTQSCRGQAPFGLCGGIRAGHASTFVEPNGARTVQRIGLDHHFGHE